MRLVDVFLHQPDPGYGIPSLDLPCVQCPHNEHLLLEVPGLNVPYTHHFKSLYNFDVAGLNVPHTTHFAKRSFDFNAAGLNVPHPLLISSRSGSDPAGLNVPHLKAQ